METLKSISDLRTESLQREKIHFSSNNFTPDLVHSKKLIAWNAWGCLKNMSDLNLEYKKELEEYYLSICERIEYGICHGDKHEGLVEDSQIEGCCSVLILKYLRYLQYSKINLTN